MELTWLSEELVREKPALNHYDVHIFNPTPNGILTSHYLFRLHVTMSC